MKYRVNTTKYIGGQSGIIPKSITINEVKQEIHFKDKITLGKKSINFSKMYEVYHDKVERVESNEYAVIWKDDRRIRLVPFDGETGGLGAAGGGGGGATATTRVDVIDPHLLQMWRDVMHLTETAPRLTVTGAAGGGGGGGGMDQSSGGTAEGGEQPVEGTHYHDITNAVTGINGSTGGAGGRGQDYEPDPPLDPSALGGPGGGGAAGNGGVICIVTTTASSPYTHTYTPGSQGAAGGLPTGATTGGDYSATAGGAGSNGKNFHIQI
jgi:hypothetical protein